MSSKKAKSIISILIIFFMIITTGYDDAVFAASKANISADTATTTDAVSETPVPVDETSVEEKSTEEVVEDSEETLDEEVATDSDALEENGIFNYAVIESDYVSAPSSQFILVDISETTDVIESATLSYTNTTKGTSYKTAATILEDTAIVFDPYFSSGQAGEYTVDSISYYVEGNEYEIVFSEIGADLRFGVNEEVEVDPLLWIVDEDYSEAEATPVENVTNDDFQELNEGDFIKIELNDLDDVDNLETNNYDDYSYNDDNSLVNKNETIINNLDSSGLSISVNSFNSKASTDRSIISMPTTNTLDSFTPAANTSNRKALIIVLDPGHGQSNGRDTGAVANGLVERDINLKIANACRDALSVYDNVKLYMTRTTSVSPYTLSGLSDFAKSVNADYLISFHNNASASSSSNGALVCVANSSYNSYVYQETNKLGNAILAQLASLGLKNRGNYVRNSENGNRYADGSIADYYSIVYNGKLNGIPQIIIEHAFMTNSSDAINFLGSDAKLAALGQADARGIANALGLSTTKKGPITIFKGKDYSDEYDKDYYLNRYPDIKKMYNGNELNTFLHYVTVGKKEGKIGNGPITIYEGIDYANVYDFDYYTSRYPDIKSAYGTNYLKVLKHFVEHGMPEGRQAIASFDVSYYKSRYADLRNAYGNDLTKYYLHYINYGKKEKRLGVPPTTVLNGVDYKNVYDYDYYISKYSDIRKIFEGDDTATLTHFVTYGMKEGRQGNSSFNVHSYKNAYVDLRTVYGKDLSKYYMHYINHGKKEGRISSGVNSRVGFVTKLNGVDYSSVYNCDYYLSKYSDLRAAYGNDDIDALKHFVNYGMKEGRQANPSFNVHSYKNAYVDLRTAYGKNLVQYYMHYINHGKKEGRISSGVNSRIGFVTKLNGVDYKDVYDYNYYTSKNPIVKQTFGDDDIDTLKHFVNSGIKSDNQASANFDVKSYIYRYPDLRRAYSNSIEKYYTHYINHGKKENRIAVGTTQMINYATTYNNIDFSKIYDYNYYVSTYPDIKKAYGYDDVATLKHFASYGINENRKGKSTYNQTDYDNIKNEINNVNSLTPIMGTTKTNVAQMVRYYRANGNYPLYYAGTDAPTIEAFCQIYYEEATAEGVRAEVAFAQAMKETGFLRFGGSVKIEQKNFAGLGATGGGISGASFSSVREGVRAQIQHLKAYGSTANLVNPVVDQRFKYVTRGSALYVEWLGINENPNKKGWATAKNYGYSLKNDYMIKLLSK